MGTFIQDFRYGVRMLAKNPGFTAVAVLTLALGIGANSAIFGVVDAILLRPLPFKDPGRLVTVWSSRPQKGWPQLPASFPDFMDWKAQSHVFEDMAAFFSYANTTFNLTGGSEPERLQAAFVSGSFFSVLGVKPVWGRT